MNSSLFNPFQAPPTMTAHRYVAALSLFALLLPFAPAADPKEKPKGKPNRLARSSSPYLLQHAHNPVDWYPWGPEAFARAKKENKLIFLSIGYSACHWCHVMEKESFANPEVAKFLNDHFICIKVDREERPDVDHIYMVSLNALGSSGGWPLSMFLATDGKPIIGGTYWPREDRTIEGELQRGFKSILLAMRDLHAKKPKDLEAQAEKVARATTTALIGLSRGISLIELNRDLLNEVTEEVKGRFDKTHGGFGNAERAFRGPKFPMPGTLLYLQGEARRTKSRELNGMVELTLDRMGRGGIYDHLGGGFHRYAVERTWTVPHFEKMLYDNAQLLDVYAAAYRQSKSAAHERVLRQTIAFLGREMTSPDGAFYSALDADSEGEEGKFYIWTAKELASAITSKEDLKLFQQVYGAQDGPNFEGRFHILRLDAPLAQAAKDLGLSEAQLEARLAPMRQKLFDIRAKRPRPLLDTKVLTAWNGQMIAGLARAGQALGDRKVIASAARAADFILRTMKTREGRLLRSYSAVPGEKPRARFNGYLDDYAFLVHGLLALHDATKEKRWLDEAQALTDTMIQFFVDDRGGFYYTSSDHEKFFVRAKDQYDGAQPAANSVAASNLVQMWIRTGKARYEKLAEQTFRSLSLALKRSPSSLTVLADALAIWLEKKGEKK